MYFWFVKSINTKYNLLSEIHIELALLSEMCMKITGEILRPAHLNSAYLAGPRTPVSIPSARQRLLVPVDLK